MAEHLPLAGLNIVVTRPREQALQLAQGVQKLGGKCIQFPLLEIAALQDERPLRALLAHLHEFQLAIFISPNAVRFGMEAIKRAQGLPETLQIATVGQGSATALQAYGVNRVIAPQQRFDSEALLELPELQQMQGKNVIIFRGDSGRELLGDTLKARGARVEYASCYQRRRPQLNIRSLLEAKPDALSISSSEALQNLWTMLNPAESRLLTALPLFVAHERIAAAAHKLGWRNIISCSAGDAGLLTALTAWATQKKGKQV